MANTDIPNYVVRFNDGDVRRAVQTYNPIAEHRIEFFYATRVPPRLQKLATRGLVGRAVAALTQVLASLGRLPFLANNIAFCIHKPAVPDDLFPWLEVKEGRVTCNRTFLEAKYRK